MRRNEVLKVTEGCICMLARSERDGEHLSKELLRRENSVQKTQWEKEWCRKSLGCSCGVMNAGKFH